MENLQTVENLKSVFFVHATNKDLLKLAELDEEKTIENIYIIKIHLNKGEKLEIPFHIKNVYWALKKYINLCGAYENWMISDEDFKKYYFKMPFGCNLHTFCYDCSSLNHGNYLSLLTFDIKEKL